jgi:glycerophosphoryl diester phosphodiesterase
LQSSRSRIFAHRGIWDTSGQNTVSAISKAVNLGFAVETDLRLLQSKIVLSHDPSPLGVADELDSILPSKTPIALNIKMDGLIPYLNVEALRECNYFFFDGSLPELYKYWKMGLKTASRVSEFEKEVPWRTEVIWLDSFSHEWWIQDRVLKNLTSNAMVVVVSPELHGRNKLKAWEIVRQEFIDGNPNIAICTDHPEEFQSIL